MILLATRNHYNPACCGALLSTVYISVSRLRENSSHYFQWSGGHASWVGDLRCDERGSIHQLCLDSRLDRVKRLSRETMKLTSRNRWSTLQASRVIPTYQTVVSWTYWSLFLVSLPGLRALSTCFMILFPFRTAVIYILNDFIPGLIGICSFW